MITEKLQQVINDQITAELWSSQLYLQMCFHLKKEGWDGFAHWMKKQAEEEKEHACAMADYLIKRGGEVKLAAIDVVPCGWGSVLEIFEHVYKHECHVSELINDVVAAASAEKDNATQDFFWGFVREQVEEEATASAIQISNEIAPEHLELCIDEPFEWLDKIKHAGEAGLSFVDSQMAQR